jgi:hypothetical protein
LRRLLVSAATRIGAGFGNFIPTGFDGGGAFFFEELAHPVRAGNAIEIQITKQKRNANLKKDTVFWT